MKARALWIERPGYATLRSMALRQLFSRESLHNPIETFHVSTSIHCIKKLMMPKKLLTMQHEKS